MTWMGMPGRVPMSLKLSLSMSLKLSFSCSCLLLLQGPALAAPTVQAPPLDAPGAPGRDWTPVGDAELADARGGFDTGTGLLVSLSIERLLSLNGDAVASTSLSLRDVAAAVQGGMPPVLGVGAGQGAQPWPTASGQLPALLLQNAANGQLIRGLTTIDATVNTLPMLKDANFADSLRQALAVPVVPR